MEKVIAILKFMEIILPLVERIGEEAMPVVERFIDLLRNELQAVKDERSLRE